MCIGWLLVQRYTVSFRRDSGISAPAPGGRRRRRCRRGRKASGKSLQLPRSRWGFAQCDSGTEWNKIRRWRHLGPGLHMCDANRSGLMRLGACARCDILIPGDRSVSRVVLVAVGFDVAGVGFGECSRGETDGGIEPGGGGRGE